MPRGFESPTLRSAGIVAEWHTRLIFIGYLQVRILHMLQNPFLDYVLGK